MKKLTLLFVIFMLLHFYSGAKEISLQKAQIVALNFYFEKYNQYEGAIAFEKIQIKNFYTSEQNAEIYYFVFQFINGGFVIVSADDNLRPVLGYSLKNEFRIENQPPNIKYWFGQFDEQVKFVRENAVKADNNVAEKWDHYLSFDFRSQFLKDNKGVEPLITTKWNQDFPFNLYCPVDSASGSYTTTGCHATAMAQIAYYWQWPDHGQGYTSYLPASNPQYGLQIADYENTWYRYHGMVDDPETANFAIAEYIYHFGAAFHTNFSTGTSMVDSIFILNHQLACDSIAYHFKFDSLQFHYRDSMPDYDWKNLLKGMLDAKYPVFYAGYSQYPITGHFFVCDGYQDDEYYHFNFGWGGTNDGNYHLDSILGYNSNQFCMSSIHPDTLQFNYPFYATGADTLFTFEGSITDGSGPIHNYLNNTQTSWLIDPQSEFDSVTNIKIMVKRLDIFDDGDKLTIFDGPDNNSPVLAEINGNTIPGDLESSGNKVFIEFITDGANTASGFYLNYNTIRPVWCSGMTQLTQAAATFNDGSGLFYYSNSSLCTWMIDPGINDALTLHFNYFNTAEESDILKIYDAGSSTLLAEISGSYITPPEPVVSPSGKIMLAFITNGANQGQGWEVWYDINTGIPENEENLALSIMPNPVISEVKISFSIQSSQHVSIIIFDKVGKMCSEVLNKYLPQGNHMAIGKINSLPEGVYFCRVQVGNETITKKIIKL